MMKRGLLILLFAAIVLVVGWRVSVDRASASDSKSASTTADATVASDASQRLALVTAHDNVGNNAVLNLQDAMHRHGPNSQEAREIYEQLCSACESMRLNPQWRPAKPEPDRAWAFAKLDAECARFHARRWPDFENGWKDTSPQLLRIWVYESEGKATALAYEGLREDVNSFHLYQSGVWLLERGLFPQQAEYGLTHEQLFHAFDFARRLHQCPPVNGCGPASIQTAVVCSQIGCPPGVSYADAMRGKLTPQQWAAAMRMLEMFRRLE